MSQITRILLQTWKRVEFTTNFDSDQIPTSYEDIKCKFRYITELEVGDHQELVSSAEAIAWFEPNASIQEGSIGLVDGKYWRVDSLVKARRLLNSNIVFLKAYLKRHELAIGS
jgi:hypothetical protein